MCVGGGVGVCGEGAEKCTHTRLQTVYLMVL